MRKLSEDTVTFRLYDRLPRDVYMTAGEIFREAEDIIASKTAVCAYIKPLEARGMLKRLHGIQTRWLKTGAAP